MNRRYFFVAVLFGLAIFVSFNLIGKANILDIFADSDDASTQEYKFVEPVDVAWSGRVIAVMGGGSCLGLEGRFEGYSQFMACLPDMNSNESLNHSGEITITGKWLGITCAYKNTIFGECVPDVEIESVE